MQTLIIESKFFFFLILDSNRSKIRNQSGNGSMGKIRHKNNVILGKYFNNIFITRQTISFLVRETGMPRLSSGPKLSMNGLGVIQRLRNKSGSTSGEA